jgi:hypothetical protein
MPYLRRCNLSQLVERLDILLTNKTVASFAQNISDTTTLYLLPRGRQYVPL